MLIGATCCVESGRHLWVPEDNRHTSFNFSRHPNFGRFMSFHKFSMICSCFSYCYADFKRNGDDPWWMILDGINNFNSIRKSLLLYTPILVVDESMSAWHPKTTARGGLPNIMYIACKPEPLGSEFKIIADRITGSFVSLEIQRGKDSMLQEKYVKELKNTPTCTLRLVDKTFKCTSYCDSFNCRKFNPTRVQYHENDIENYMKNNPDYYNQCFDKKYQSNLE